MAEEFDEPTKRQIIAAQILKKKKCDKLALDIVNRLIEPNVDRDSFLKDAALIAPHHMDDITEERHVSRICGWVLCDEKITNIPRQQYKIRNNKVYDITDRKKFCSSKCYGISIHFKAQMSTSPLWLRDEEPVPVFTILEPGGDKDDVHGLTVKVEGITLDDEEEDSDDNDIDIDIELLNPKEL